MPICPNCGKELKWYKRFGKFCSLKCNMELVKILKELKKQDLQKKTELKLNNRKPTATDIKRQKKIKEIENILGAGLGTKLFVGGFIGGMGLSMSGVFMMVIGTVLCFTIIGAIVGIPLMIIGFIMFIGSGIVALLGAGSGVVAGIVKAIKNRKK
jgi:uncharacterized membrane protein YbhN (UPF0104 family)